MFLLIVVIIFTIFTGLFFIGRYTAKVRVHKVICSFFIFTILWKTSSINPYHAEFFKWNNPPSIYGTFHFHFKAYQDEYFKLVLKCKVDYSIQEIRHDKGKNLD